MVYLVKQLNGDNSGTFYSTRDEAERQAEYLNDIPDAIEYVVEAVKL